MNPQPLRLMNRTRMLIAISRRLEMAEREMWKLWAISKVDRSNELARARYVAAVRRCGTLKTAMRKEAA